MKTRQIKAHWRNARQTAEYYRRQARIRRPSEQRFIEDIACGKIATGISSQAMAYSVLGLPGKYRDPEREMPYDMGDWGRCVMTYNRAPEHLKRKMRPIMADYAERLRKLGEQDKTDWRTKGLKWPLPYESEK